MTNGSIILRKDDSLFSPVSVLHYEFYDDPEIIVNSLTGNPGIQCIVGMNFIPFGQSQQPALTDYADSVDTLQFLLQV
jgi:hypothetical protein